MKRSVLGWSAAGLIAVAVGVGLFVHPASSGAAQVVASEAPVREIVAPGVVESASNRVDLAFEVAGRVDEIAVEEGAHVTRGQLLMRLDDRLARAHVARAEAALASAIARKDLAFHGARADEIHAAEAELAAAIAQSTERSSSSTRAQKLLGADAISVADVDATRASADVAKSQAQAAEARLALLRQGSRSEAKRDAVAAVAAAEADLAEARALLAQTELRAPRDGVVLRRNIEVGQQVTMMPPTVVIGLADTDHLVLRAEIDESDVGRVVEGLRGFATAEAFGDRRFEGHVTRVLGELGRKKVVTDDARARIDTRVLEVMFTLDEGSKLPLGLRLDLHLADAAAKH